MRSTARGSPFMSRSAGPRGRPPVSLDANRPMRYEPRTMRLPRLSRPLLLPVVLATVLAALVPHLARAAGDPHGVDMLPILEALVLMLIGAKLGGDVFERIGQPAVLGELLAGVLVG